MKSFNKIIALAFAIIILMFATVNLIPRFSKTPASLLKVEAHRIVAEIEKTGNIPDVDKYSTVSGIYAQGNEEDFFISDSEYVIREINGKLYRIEYLEPTENTSEIIYVNVFMAVFSVFVLIVLFYIRHNIVKPFDRITTFPYELSKGNLTIPLKESKNRYFGKFLWG
ncbi:MAG: sensor histidine kinase, partial [Acutalibacteraceae bacterium]|nr:sensor histidine kinase [Acutalibacteraceae bacterium]